MTWTAKLIKHNSEIRIAVYFEKNQDLIARIKQITGARWSQQKIVWHLPDSPETGYDLTSNLWQIQSLRQKQ